MKKILILGSYGLVGSSFTRNLSRKQENHLLIPARKDLDLLSAEKTLSFVSQHKPDLIIMAAAKVGGIHANNTLRADFIFENLQVQQSVFNAAFKNRTPRLLFLGSSCIYPKLAPQPIKEEYLLSSALEPTNEPYAIAKIAGLKTVESFRRQYGFKWQSVMPTNLYGINDNFDLENSHVIPGLIARLHQAMVKGEKTFTIWGSGKPRREFLYVDDMVDACLKVLEHESSLPDFVNVGSGEDVEIGEVAKLIAKKMNFKGELLFDTSKPDGTPRKLLDISYLKSLGWKPQTSLEEGLEKTIDFYLSKRS